MFLAPRYVYYCIVLYVRLSHLNKDYLLTMRRSVGRGQRQLYV